MNSTEVIDFLHSMERDLPVDTWQVDGIDVWPLLRLQLYARLYTLGEPEDSSTPHRRSLLERVRDGGHVIAHTLAEDARARLRDPQRVEREADAVFLTYSTCRSFPIGGRWYDITCQPIVELLAQRGKRSILWELAPGEEYRLPRAYPSRLVQARTKLLGYVNAFVPAPAIQLEGSQDLARMLGERSGDALATLAHSVRLVRWLANDFKRSLVRAKARVGLVVNYYDTIGMAFVLACHELGLPSIDVQHGVQGPLHPAYGRWSRVPPHGYRLLPSIFWTWSQSEADTIHEWARRGSAHEALVGGNLLLAKFKSSGDPLVQAFDDRVRDLASRGQRNLLVTLQPGRGVPPLLRTAVREAPPTWRWWIRLHPSMMKERSVVEAALSEVRDRVYLDEALLPLYALLRHVDVHVTETSSTILEAEDFGVPSITCHPDGVELFGDRATYVTSAQALCAAAGTLKRGQPEATRVIDAAMLDAFLEDRT